MMVIPSHPSIGEASEASSLRPKGAKSIAAGQGAGWPHARNAAAAFFSAFLEDSDGMSKVGSDKLDRIVAEARRAAETREQGYREQALKIYPWICGRCAREFTRANVRELTVHHRDHNHHNNPPDGSNWELLCLYCHDNEHQRQLESAAGESSSADGPAATFAPFADLKALLAKRERSK